MKKDLFKKPLMISLALCLSASVNVFASTTDVTAPGAASTVTGVSTLESGKINVVVPVKAAVTFVVDPLEKTEPGQQIVSAQLPVVNKSDIPVKVSVDTTIVVDGTTVTTTNFETPPREDVNQAIDGVNAAKYQAYVGLLPAATATFDTSTNKLTNATDSKTIEVAVSNDTAGTPANLTFALDKATYDAGTFKALAANNKGVGSFRFVGKINPHVTWADDNIAPKVKYTITAINDTVMKAYKSIPETNALVGATKASAISTVSRPSMTYATKANVYKKSAKTDLVYTLDPGKGASGGDTIMEVRLGGFPIAPNVGYKYEPVSKSLTILKDCPVFANSLTTVGDYYIIVTYANGNKTVSDFKIEA